MWKDKDFALAASQCLSCCLIAPELNTPHTHTHIHTLPPLRCSAPSISGIYLQLEADEAVCYMLSWQPGQTVFPLCRFPRDGTAAAHSDTQVNTIAHIHIQQQSKSLSKTHFYYIKISPATFAHFGNSH